MRPEILAAKTKYPNCQIEDNRNNLLDRLPSNGIVAEVGVFKGEYSKIILRRSKPQKLHLIDCWKKQSSNEYYDIKKRTQADLEKIYIDLYRDMLSHIKSNQVKMHRGMSLNVVKEFPDKYFDWVYIDANHFYKTTKADLEAYEPKVKKNGYICGHDFLNYRVYGVVKAVNEFCDERGWEIRYLTADRFSSYILKRKH